METAAPIALLETELLSWDDILDRYPGEYVCLVDVKRDADGGVVRAARVVGRGPTRDAAFEPIREVADRYPGFEIRQISVLAYLDGEIDQEAMPMQWLYRIAVDDEDRVLLDETPRFVVREG